MLATILASSVIVAALTAPLPAARRHPNAARWLSCKRVGGLRFIRLGNPYGAALSLSWCVTRKPSP